MRHKKVCLLGTSAVGKTSLVKRFVQGIFSDKYMTTVGVKIDRKTESIDGRDVDLLLWDLNGEDRFQKLSMSYLRGASGYLLVVDGTRRQTLDAALVLHHKARAALGDIPCLMLLNKADLTDAWDFDQPDLAELEAQGWTIFRTSAKMGTGVEEAFQTLAQLLSTPDPATL